MRLRGVPKQSADVRLREKWPFQEWFGVHGDCVLCLVVGRSASGISVQGDLAVTNQGDAVAIRGVITGLAPGSEHGFHVHEFGDCSLPDFKNAGDHYDPTMAPNGEHLGDLPNIKTDKNGHASVDVTVKGPNLVDPDGAPTQIIGKSLVIHAMPDDHKTQPSGGSGARVTCGVIRFEHL